MLMLDVSRLIELSSVQVLLYDSSTSAVDDAYMKFFSVLIIMYQLQ